MGFFKRDQEVWLKGGQSPVSEADFAVDAFLRDTLTAARPDYGWLSEETADLPGRLAARRTFVVDPIDGTRAFLEGKSTWCVSVAVVEAGRPLAGVLECPARAETYQAELGCGAFRRRRQAARFDPRRGPRRRRPEAADRRHAGGPAAPLPPGLLHPVARLPPGHGGLRRARRDLRQAQRP